MTQTDWLAAPAVPARYAAGRRPEGPAARAGWLLRAQLVSSSRPALFVEVALLAVSYWAYSAVRNAAPQRGELALQHASELLAFERGLGLDIELKLNRVIATMEWLVVPTNYYYATLHFAATIGVLVWLYRRHGSNYRAARTVLYATTAFGLVCFYFYPLAPPRLMPGSGFVDTVVAFETWGSMASGDLASLSNPYAAMPSLHTGWALWCGLAVLGLARRWWVRLLGALYPVLTVFVIVATANHFVLDAVGGAAALGAGYAVPRVLGGRQPFRAARPALPSRGASEVVIPGPRAGGDLPSARTGSRRPG